MADLDVTVGVGTAEAEEGLRRLSGQFHREIESINRSKATAKFGAEIKDFERGYREVKAHVKEMEKQQAIQIEMDLDHKAFDAELREEQAKLRALETKRTTIHVNYDQLKKANREMDISAKKQESMARQTEKLNRARSKGEETHRRELLNLSKEGSELAKLEVAYSKLSRKKSQLEKEGMFTFGGWPGRTKDEELALHKVGTELDHVGAKIKSMGGDLDHLDRNDRFGSKLLSWVTSLKDARVHLGFFSARLGTFAKALAVLGPLVLSLTGGLSALVGVLGAGIVGARAVGAAALGGFALSMAGVGLAAKGMIGHLKEQVKAAHDYRDAVLKYGKGSEEAATKLGILQHVTKGISPDALKMVKGFAGVREEWEKLTKPSRKPFFSIAEQGLKTIKGLMPEIATETNKTFAVLAHSIDPILKELRGAGAQGAIGTLMSNFRDSLPNLIHGLAEFGKGLANISVEASKFLPQVTGGFNKWSEGFANETGTSKFKARLDEMIRQAGDLLHLFHVAGQAIVLFFGAGAEAGDDMTNHLSATIEKWNEWMRSIEGQKSLHSFFDQSSKDTENFFGALVPLLRTFTELARALQPVTGGMLALARALSEITTEIARIPVMSNILKGFGVVIGTAFVVGKIQKWSTAIREAAVALGVLRAAEVATAETGAATAATTAAGAGGAAAATRGGIMGGLLGGINKAGVARLGAIGLGAGLLKGVVNEVENNSAKASDDIITAFKAKLDQRSIAEKGFGIDLPSWLNPTFNSLTESSEEKAVHTLQPALEEVLTTRTKIGKAQEEQLRAAAREANLTEDQMKQVQAILRLAQQGRKLHISIGGGMDPKAINEIIAGYHKLRSGALASLGDIAKVTKQNAALIAATLPRGSEEARRKTAENFRAAADAIKKAMENGTIAVGKGTQRMRELLRNAKLLEGKDPLGIARGFANSWKEAGGINQKNRERVIDELRKMPPKARAEAYRFMLQYGKGLVRGGKISEEDLRLFKSGAITELQGIGAGFSGLSATVYKAMGNIATNLTNALKGMGGNAPHFNLKQLKNMLPTVAENEKRLGQQQGGFTVPGSGSGDKVPRTLPYGAFVMNREASKAYGFTSGGGVQTILEPKERVFMPHEVARYGPESLAAMNAAVPRKAGGPIGPMPQIEGNPSTALSAGQGAIGLAYKAAAKFFDTQKAKFATAGGGYTGPAEGPAGTSMYHGVLMATWVRQALEYGAAHGSGDPQPTSGYRSHAQNVAEGRNYYSEHEKTQYPGGAVDFGGMVDPSSLPLKMAVVRATAGYKYPLLAPAGFRDDGHASGTGHMMGGFIERLINGGFIDADSTQEGVASRIGKTLLNNGFNYKGAAGIIGNAWRESLWNPASIGTGGRGLWGFDFYEQQLLNEAGRKGVSWSDTDFQTHFMLNGPEPAMKLRSTLNGAPNAAVAAEDFERSWERAGVVAMSDRVNGAREAMRIISEGGAAPSAGGAQHGVPKSVAAKVHSYRVQGKNLVGSVREAQVPLDIPDFGPVPEKEGEVRRELAQLEHKMLPEYRAALRQHAQQKSVAEHLRASLKKIEGRIRELRDKLREIRYAKSRGRFGKKVKRQLGKITGQEGLIEAAQRNYEEKQQYAEQVVGSEPEQPGTITEDWLTNTFEPYINAQETPAYANVLGAENHWRNVTLAAEQVAEGMEKNWEATIGWTSKGRKPFLEDPNLHFPPHGKGEATGLASWIYELHDQIDRIRGFAGSHDSKWWGEHPSARKRRDAELASIDNSLAPQLALAKFKRKSLTGSLGEGRDSFQWFSGTGGFEQSLQDVQGLHWPEQHDKLSSLPGFPTPGIFGGAIYETQETIQDLGLKISQAKESLENVNPGDRGGEITSFEEAIRGLLAGRPFISLNQGPGFMGAFARGGVALVGERGPELAHLPNGTRIHDAEDTARMLNPEVVVDLSRLKYGPWGPGGPSTGAAPGGKVINVDLKNYFPTPPPDPHTWARGQVFELEAIA